MENVEEDKWQLEHEPEQPPKLEFKPKAHLVLEGSDQHEWGLVKDCHGLINIIPDDAEIVGVWNKYASGPEGNLIFWVSLQTSLSALEDRATQLYRELSEGRAEAMQRMGVVVPAKKAPRTKAERVERPKHDEFAALREKLRGK